MRRILIKVVIGVTAFLMLSGASALFTPQARLVLPTTSPYQEVEDYSYIPAEWRDTVKYTAVKYGVPVMVIHSIISVESGYVEDAVGPVNYNGSRDMGLGQLNSDYLIYFVETFWEVDRPFEVFNGHDNIEMCGAILASLYDIFGNWEQAIKSYNVGAGSILNGKRTGAANRYYDKVVVTYREVKRSLK